MIDELNRIEYELDNPKGTKLEYDEFKKYEIQPKVKGQWIFRFENNYGASVVKRFGSYGYDKDLFEMAVIRFFDDSNNFYITYKTSIARNVIGYLNNNEVIQYLREIQKIGGLDGNEFSNHK